MELRAVEKEILVCRRCPRLVQWREEVARKKRPAYEHWRYWGKPVPGFGDERARVMVVGLAPGAHGSNRTGRQFTGDASGEFLFAALHQAGFSSKRESLARDDDLTLRDLFLTASCRCVPPANRPLPDELARCRPYLEREIRAIRPKVIVCLGRIAFDTVLKVHALASSKYVFQHGAKYRLPRDTGTGIRWLLCSYHPSRQNTNTGRLTKRMFGKIWRTARTLLEDE